MKPAPNHPWHRGKASYAELSTADLLDLPREEPGAEGDDPYIPAVERRRIEAHRPLLEAGYDPTIGTTADQLDLCVRALGTALPIQEDFGRYAQDIPHLGTFMG